MLTKSQEQNMERDMRTCMNLLEKWVKVPGFANHINTELETLRRRHDTVGSCSSSRARNVRYVMIGNVSQSYIEIMMAVGLLKPKDRPALDVVGSDAQKEASHPDGKRDEGSSASN